MTGGSDNLPRFALATAAGVQFVQRTTQDCADFLVNQTAIRAEGVSLMTGVGGDYLIGVTDATGIKVMRCSDEDWTA